MQAPEPTIVTLAQPGRAPKIAAAAVALTALALALAGTIALAANALRDGNGYFSWPTETFTSNGYAIAMKTVDISNAPQWVFTGSIQVGTTAADSRSGVASHRTHSGFGSGG